MVATIIAAAAVGAIAGSLLALWLVQRSFERQIADYKAQLALWRADLKQERRRADNAVDALTLMVQGGPISPIAIEERARSFEEKLRTGDETAELFMDETRDDDAPAATDEPGT